MLLNLLEPIENFLVLNPVLNSLRPVPYARPLGHSPVRFMQTDLICGLDGKKPDSSNSAIFRDRKLLSLWRVTIQAICERAASRSSKRYIVEVLLFYPPRAKSQAQMFGYDR